MFNCKNLISVTIWSQNKRLCGSYLSWNIWTYWFSLETLLLCKVNQHINNWKLTWKQPFQQSSLMMKLKVRDLIWRKPLKRSRTSHILTLLSYFHVRDRNKSKVNTLMQKWCTKVWLYQSLTLVQMLTLSQRFSHQNWLEMHKPKKYSHLLITTRWNSWLSKTKCHIKKKNKTFSSLRMFMLLLKNLLRRRTSPTILSIPLTKSSHNLIKSKMRKMKTMMSLSMTLAKLRWSSSRKELVIFWWVTMTWNTKEFPCLCQELTKL